MGIETGDNWFIFYLLVVSFYARVMDAEWIVVTGICCKPVMSPFVDGYGSWLHSLLRVSF